METAGEFNVLLLKKKESEDGKVQDEKLQGSEHKVINQPLQDYSYFLRKEGTHIGNPILRDWRDQKQVRDTSPSLTWIENWRHNQYCSSNFWNLMSRVVSELEDKHFIVKIDDEHIYYNISEISKLHSGETI